MGNGYVRHNQIWNKRKLNWKLNKAIVLRLGMMRRHYLYFHGNDIVNDWDIVWGLWHEWHIACDKSRSMDHYQLKNAFFRVSNKLPKFLAYIILDSISWLWFLVVFWWYGLVGILVGIILLVGMDWYSDDMVLHGFVL